jgi:hypothetical protein
VLASFHGFDCPGCVFAIGQRDVYRVNIRILEQLIIAAVSFRNGISLGKLLRTHQVTAGDGNY